MFPVCLRVFSLKFYIQQIFPTNRLDFSHKLTWFFPQSDMILPQINLKKCAHQDLTLWPFTPGGYHCNLSPIAILDYLRTIIRQYNFKVLWKTEYCKVTYYFFLFYSILFYSILYILFFSILLYSILYYNNKVRWRKINLLPPGLELATSRARRPHGFFSRLFAGFNMYCLFVFIFQFIILWTEYFPSICGKYRVHILWTEYFPSFVGNIQFIFFGLNISRLFVGNIHPVV